MILTFKHFLYQMSARISAFLDSYSASVIRPSSCISLSCVNFCLGFSEGVGAGAGVSSWSGGAAGDETAANSGARSRTPAAAATPTVRGNSIRFFPSSVWIMIRRTLPSAMISLVFATAPSAVTLNSSVRTLPSLILSLLSYYQVCFVNFLFPYESLGAEEPWFATRAP